MRYNRDLQSLRMLREAIPNLVDRDHLRRCLTDTCDDAMKAIERNCGLAIDKQDLQHRVGQLEREADALQGEATKWRHVAEETQQELSESIKLVVRHAGTILDLRARQQGATYLADNVIRRKGRADVTVAELEGLEEELRRTHTRVTLKSGAIQELKRRLALKTRMVERMQQRSRNDYGRIREQAREIEALEQRLHHAERRLAKIDEDRRAVLELHSTLNFGKWHGMTLAHVVATDPSYVVWMLENHSTQRPCTQAVDAARDVISGMVRRAVDQAKRRDVMSLGAPAGQAVAMEWKHIPGGVGSDQADPGDEDPQLAHYRLGVANWMTKGE
jgi:predicted  nucleic acid-binding Zn-ribbon protein